MSVKSVLKCQNFKVEKEEGNFLKKEVENFTGLLKKELKKYKIKAEVFIGGSFAKNTLAQDEEYDVDIFIRFSKKENDISYLLEKVVKRMAKAMKREYKKLHGSRDYFRIHCGKLTFEIIPVLRVKKIGEGENVTDSSYFHVKYVRRHLKKNMTGEVLLAKKFCKAEKIYGAESYINGFSGYGLECLIIYYKTFEKMLRELVKVKDQLIIDPAKHYKNKSDSFLELNESKTKGPIILIDPTWKERNVLAALNFETFRKFQTAARKFLKNPSKKFFELKYVDVNKMKKKKGEFLHIILRTDRQEGDIAGTKMKKFSNFLTKNLEKYFDVLDKEFSYKGSKEADFYIVAKSRGEVVRRGPPRKMSKDAKLFRKKNKGKVFEKKGVLYMREKIDFSAKKFLLSLKKNSKEMGISEMKI